MGNVAQKAGYRSVCGDDGACVMGWPDDDLAPLTFGATVALFLAFAVACGLGCVSVLALAGVL